MPDPGFAQESEPCPLYIRSALRVSDEEYGRAKNPLEGAGQTTIMRAALLHRERSSICAVLSDVIRGLFCRIANVAGKMGTN
jgi:hypothetical protein